MDEGGGVRRNDRCAKGGVECAQRASVREGGSGARCKASRAYGRGGAGDDSSRGGLRRGVVAWGSSCAERRIIGQGLPIYVALEPVDMRFGYERLGGLVREKMQAEPRSKALFVFVGKRGHSMKVLTWDGTGAIVVHKKLDAGKFELPKTTRVGDQHVIVSDAIFEVIYKGVATAPKAKRRRTH